MSTGRTGPFAEQALTRLLEKVRRELDHQPTGTGAQQWLRSVERDLRSLRRQLVREREEAEHRPTTAFRPAPSLRDSSPALHKTDEVM